MRVPERRLLAPFACDIRALVVLTAAQFSEAWECGITSHEWARTIDVASRRIQDFVIAALNRGNQAYFCREIQRRSTTQAP